MTLGEWRSICTLEISGEEMNVQILRFPTTQGAMCDIRKIVLFHSVMFHFSLFKHSGFVQAKFAEDCVCFKAQPSFFSDTIQSVR